MVSNILDWISGLGFDMPGLSWLKYVFAFVILAVIIDAFLNLIFASLHSLFSGGKR